MEPTHDEALLRLLEEVACLGPARREMARCTAATLHAGAAAVVWELEVAGPLRVVDLATALRVDVSVVSRQVAELTADGLIDRCCDPADRRASLLSVTERGREVLEATTGRVVERFRHGLEHWEPADLVRVADDLRRLRTDLLAPAAA